MNIYDALILKAVGGGGGTTVVANPEGEATDELEKLQVGNDIYEIPKDYEDLDNKPQINSVELEGNKTASDLGLQTELKGAQTLSGNPITITDAEPMNAESVVVELEPKQDLHGYDAPWVGGAGKNKLPLVLADIKAANTTGTWNGNVYTHNSVDFTVFTDSDENVTGVNVNGTTSDYSRLELATVSNFSTRILSGCPNGGSSSGYKIRVANSSDVGIGEDVGNGYTIPSDSSYKISINVGTGISVSNEVFYPMIRKSTDSADFEPYSNICPISGYSEVNVERVGKNWLNPATFSHTNPNTGETDNNWAYWTYTNCKPETIYSLDCNVELQSVFVSNINFYDKYYNNIGRYGAQYKNPNNITFTTPANVRYFNIVFYHNTSLASYDFTKAQVLEGSAIDEIIPYQGSTATISLGGTKYGGTLDVTEGGYSDEWGYISGSSVSDLVSAGMSSDTTSAGLYCMVLGSSAEPQADDQTATSDKLVCNDMENITANQGWGTNVSGICINQVGHVIFTVKDITTQADMDTWLSNNPIQIAYRKKTPSSVSTTPTDIPLLENTNNISTDGTNITLKYQPNNVIGECKVYTDEKCSEVLPPLPTTDGTYHLSCEVTSGVGVLSWVSDS